MLDSVQNHLHLNTTEQKRAFERDVGFFPMFPVQNLSYSATLIGGFEFSIPQTSRNKDFAWELATIILEPKIWYHIIQNIIYYRQRYP